MTMAEFAGAVGADPKWIYNASHALGQRFERTLPESRWLRLARLIQEGSGMPLARAASFAREALRGGEAAPTVEIPMAADASVLLKIDLGRFESSFAAAITAARGFGGARRRGRVGRPHADPIAAARGRGVDIGLLRRGLSATPGERLAQLDENRAFLQALRKTSK